MDLSLTQNVSFTSTQIHSSMNLDSQIDTGYQEMVGWYLNSSLYNSLTVSMARHLNNRPPTTETMDPHPLTNDTDFNNSRIKDHHGGSLVPAALPPRLGLLVSNSASHLILRTPKPPQLNLSFHVGM